VTETIEAPHWGENLFLPLCGQKVTALASAT